jgi:hypothetical protein
MDFRKIILAGGSFFLCLFLHAQKESFIRAQTDKQKILLGEPFTLSIDARTGHGTRFPRIDSFSHFEFLDPPIIDSSNENGFTTVKAKYTLTSFDSGRWAIPQVKIGTGKLSDSLPIDVVFSDFDSTQDYHDIKDIINVKAKKQTPWWWYAAGGLVLLALILFFVLLKK